MKWCISHFSIAKNFQICKQKNLTFRYLIFYHKNTLGIVTIYSIIRWKIIVKTVQNYLKYLVSSIRSKNVHMQVNRFVVLC